MEITKKDACISELELDLEEASSADAHKQLALEVKIPLVLKS